MPTMETTATMSAAKNPDRATTYDKRKAIDGNLGRTP